MAFTKSFQGFVDIRRDRGLRSENDQGCNPQRNKKQTPRCYQNSNGILLESVEVLEVIDWTYSKDGCPCSIHKLTLKLKIAI
jgi:hypothetical protein